MFKRKVQSQEQAGTLRVQKMRRRRQKKGQGLQALEDQRVGANRWADCPTGLQDEQDLNILYPVDLGFLFKIYFPNPLGRHGEARGAKHSPSLGVKRNGL